ncbi:MAG: tetratricopeptide repeat protein [Cytophagales bacterium]|nr:tetratricopeptide repeat protein [Cytophagales bacterium]
MKKLIIFIIAANAGSLILKPPDNSQLIASLTQTDTTSQDHKSTPLFPGTREAGSEALDSLKNALKNATHDTTRVNILLQIVENIYDDNVWPEYNRQALDIAEKNIPRSKGAVLLAFKKAKAASLNNIGYIHNVQGNPDKALEYYLQSLEIGKEINDKQGIATSLNNIGMIYKNQGNLDKALENFLQSLEIQKEINDKQGIATSLNNIGLIYKNQGNPDKALEYYLQSLKILKEINDKQDIARSLNNIANIYYDQGNHDPDLIGMKRDSLFNRALEYHLQSLEIKKEINDKQGIAYSLNNIGAIYYNQGNPDKALEYYLQSLEIQKEINYKRGIAYSLNFIGLIYLERKDYTTAADYCTRSLFIAEELGYPENIMRSAGSLHKIYKAMAKKAKKQGLWEYGERYATAIEYNELYTQMRDTVHNNAMSKAIGKVEGKFEFKMALKQREQREKEQELKKAKETSHRNNLQNGAIAIGIFVLLTIIIFLGNFVMPGWLVNALSFVPFVLLFEFITELTEPWTEGFTGDQPIYEVLINTVVVLIIFPIQYIFEKKLRERLYRAKKKRAVARIGNPRKRRKGSSSIAFHKKDNI